MVAGSPSGRLLVERRLVRIVSASESSSVLLVDVFGLRWPYDEPL